LGTSSTPASATASTAASTSTAALVAT
jgi:hypothetical protein